MTFVIFLLCLLFSIYFTWNQLKSENFLRIVSEQFFIIYNFLICVYPWNKYKLFCFSSAFFCLCCFSPCKNLAAAVICENKVFVQHSTFKEKLFVKTTTENKVNYFPSLLNKFFIWIYTFSLHVSPSLQFTVNWKEAKNAFDESVEELLRRLEGIEYVKYKGKIKMKGWGKGEKSGKSFQLK